VEIGDLAQKTAAKEGLERVEVWRSAVGAWRRLDRNSEKNLASLGLALAELRILKALQERGSSPMNTFSAATMLSQPTITGIVDRLEARGLVERVRSSQDRREVLIAITPKGSRAYSKGIEMHRRFVERSLSGLEAGEVEALVRIMGKIADASDSIVKE
jgi:MarR family transcriptional regulator, 2-MHQ and catechol-resistance regulon repressor